MDGSYKHAVGRARPMAFNWEIFFNSCSSMHTSLTYTNEVKKTFVAYNYSYMIYNHCYKCWISCSPAILMQCISSQSVYKNNNDRHINTHTINKTFLIEFVLICFLSTRLFCITMKMCNNYYANLWVATCVQLCNNFVVCLWLHAW